MKVKLVESANEIPRAPIVGLDIETYPKKKYREHALAGLHPALSEIALVQVAVPGDAVYVLRNNFESMAPFLEDRSVMKLIHNGSFELKFLGEIEPIVDTMIVEVLLNNGKQGLAAKSLEDVTERHLGIKLKKDVRKKFIGRQKLDKSMVEYGAMDAAVLPLIYAKQRPNFYEGMERVLKVELALLPIVAQMELAGVGIDPIAWRKINVENKAELDKCSRILSKALGSGVERASMFGGTVSGVNLNSRAVKAKLLDKLGLEVDNQRRGTIEEAAASRLDDPDIKALLRYSQLQKLVSTYGENVLSLINPVTGRLHQSISQMEARTGRLASSEPNLMNIPVRDGGRIRGCFISKPGYKLIALDFSQQEYRILAQFCKDPEMIKAFEAGIDIHLFVAQKLFRDPTLTAKDKAKRKHAKNMNFGIVYGMGPKKLARDLGVSIGRAKESLEEYFNYFPGIRGYVTWSKEFVEEHGYVETLLGRRRTLDMEGHYEQEARNTPIQGSAADMTKLALVAVAKMLIAGQHDAQIINVVHDEIVLECEGSVAEEVAELAKASMIKAAGILVNVVPFDVDYSIGLRWEKQ